MTIYSSPQLVDTLKTQTEQMSPRQLSLACAYLVAGTGGFVLEEHQDGTVSLTDHHGKPHAFDILGSWESVGLLLTNVGLVVGSHPLDSEDATQDRKCWYSAHAYVSGTQKEGYDYRKVIAFCAVELLRHNILYPNV